MFSYFSRIYYLGEEVKRLKDGTALRSKNFSG
jgi:hypothetical protein